MISALRENGSREWVKSKSPTLPFPLEHDALVSFTSEAGRRRGLLVQCMPIEADGRLRYRIKSKSGNIERVF
jgi:hypothetical protein